MSPSTELDPAGKSLSVRPGLGGALRSRHAPVQEVVGKAPSDAEIVGEALAVAALPVAVAEPCP